jgi:hypothetical protein
VAVVSTFHRNVALVLGPFYSLFGRVEIVPDLDAACSASPLLAAHRRGHQHDDKDDCDRDHHYDDAGLDGEHHDSAEHVESFLADPSIRRFEPVAGRTRPVTPAFA